MAANCKKKCGGVFSVGTKVKVVSNVGGHMVPIGTIGTISMGPDQVGAGYYRIAEYPQYAIIHGDLEPVSHAFTKEYLASEKQNLQAEIAMINAKINYLEETGKEKGCMKEFRVYHALSVMEDGNLTKKQKAAAIADMLDS